MVKWEIGNGLDIYTKVFLKNTYACIIDFGTRQTKAID